MQNNDAIRRAIRYALYANLAATTAGIAVASAADTSTTADDTDESSALSEVVVTGSRISQPGLQSISPVTSVSAQEIKLEGTTRIEDLLNNLPQVMADQGSMISNGATGEATVNLRGLGTQRTLVLINGRRLMPGDPTQPAASAPDLNQIPAALVERVDVLTGGASAVYGADAVAGVVNFVMNDHFQGIEVDGNLAAYNHDQHNPVSSIAAAAGDALPHNTTDGATRDVTFIMGSNFADDKGNMTAYLGYRKIDAILQGARDFSACSLEGGASFACGGSSTSSTGRFFATNGNFFPFPYLTIGPGSQLVPYNEGPGDYNYGPTNYYQRPDERYTGGVFGHYDYSDHAEAYTEFMFMHDESIAQVAASGAFIGSGTGVSPTTGIPDGDWAVNCNNPLLSAQEEATLCAGAVNGVAQVLFGRRNVEGGDRQDDLIHTSFRMVLGTKGDLSDAFKFDVYGMIGETIYAENYLNDVSKARITNALDVVTSPTTGQPICAANLTGNNAPGCVPYNIWTLGGVTPAAAAYISVPSFKEGYTQEDVTSGSITGDLTQYGIKTPWAKSGLAVVLGAEWREELAVLKPDIENETNDLAGQGNPVLPLNAGMTVREVFTEERLPLIEDAFLAKEVSFETGYRYSDYNLGFKTNTYKFGVDWAPTSDIRGRASYQRAVRAPNLQELFAEKYVGNDLGADPCATSSGYPPTASATACAHTGVTSAQYGKIAGNPAGQYQGLIGGNPTLKPEQSDTVTFGLVFTPTFVPNLAVTLDYFDIRIRNVITSYGASFTLNECLNNDLPQFCSLVHRDATGSLWLSPEGYVDDPTLNLGSLLTRGVDVTASYKLDLNRFGHLDFNFLGTYTASLITEPVPGLGSYDCAGYFGNTCGDPDPKWRHKMRISWGTPLPGLEASLQWRHINSVISDTLSGNPLLSGSTLATNAELGTRDYFDLTASYQIVKGVSLLVGVDNVLDKDPPIIGGADYSNAFVNGNTYPQLYDTLGRYLFAHITAKL